MKALENYLDIALVILTFLTCFVPGFAFSCMAVAFGIVLLSMMSPKTYEPMITFCSSINQPAAA